MRSLLPLPLRLAAATVSLVVVACSDTAAPNLGSNPATETYAATLGVDLTQMTKINDALYIQDQTPGTGTPVVAGDSITVTYSGWLVNGTKFDANTASGISFHLGVGRVIPGWDQGLLGLKLGGKRRLVIGSRLGYGASGGGPIPPNATLVFDVQLVSIH